VGMDVLKSAAPSAAVSMASAAAAASKAEDEAACGTLGRGADDLDAASKSEEHSSSPSS